MIAFETQRSPTIKLESLEVEVEQETESLESSIKDSISKTSEKAPEVPAKPRVYKKPFHEDNKKYLQQKEIEN